MNVHLGYPLESNKSRLREFKGRQGFESELLEQIRELGMTGMTITGIFAALPSNIDNFYLRSIAAYIIYNAVNLSFNVGLFHIFFKKLLRGLPGDLLSSVLHYIQNTAEISVLVEATLLNKKNKNNQAKFIDHGKSS